MAKSTTLNEIARGAAMDLGLDESRHEQFLYWAIEGYKDFYWDIDKEPKRVYIEADKKREFALPKDYVDWLKLGIIDNNKLLEFTHRDDLYYDVPDKVIEPKKGATGYPYNYADYGFYEHFNDQGDFVGRQFNAHGHIDRGYFTIRDGYIWVDPVRVDATHVILLYLSDGVDPEGGTLVKSMASKMIKEYIHWRASIFDNAPMGVQQMAEKRYYVERKKVGRRHFSWSREQVDEILDEGVLWVK